MLDFSIRVNEGRDSGSRDDNGCGAIPGYRDKGIVVWRIIGISSKGRVAKQFVDTSCNTINTSGWKYDDPVRATDKYDK